MSSVLDLMFSMVVGIAIFGVIITASQNASDESSLQRKDTQAMESLLSTVEVLEGDMRNIGSGVADTLLMVSNAELAAVTFHEVLSRGSGKIDTIAYYIGSPGELTKTENPNDRYLYRKVNLGQPLRIGTVSEFMLRYLTAAGGELPVPVPSNRLSEITALEVTLEVQSPHALENAAGIGGPKRYPAARIAGRRFESKNLKR